MSERLLAILTPPPRLNVVEWADRYRFLSPESSANPGKYRSEFAPYQRGPMIDATDPSVSSVTLMWPSQVGKTEVLLNVAGYFIDADPAPILVVQPTVELAESFSKERLTPMIRDTPRLRGLVHDQKSRDSGNTILLKTFPGGNVAIVGANAPGGLAGRPRRVVLLDEVDRFPPSAGTEGDPCSLAERRTETFWNAVIYRASSPTYKGSRIEKFYEATDKREWFCPCPRCGHFQILKWSQVLWGTERVIHWQRFHPGEPTTPAAEDGSDAVYACENCNAHLSDEERVWMVLRGEWRATAPFAGRRGYHISGICSPFKPRKGFKSRLHQMVSDFLNAKHGGRETLKTWVNTFLAEPFEEEAERIEPSALMERLEDYSPQKLPSEILFVTAQVDVQKDRLEVETVGIGIEDESWGIERRVLHGDTEQRDVWENLAMFLRNEYLREDGIKLKISACAVDMRFKPKRVIEFVRSGAAAMVFPVYGVESTSPLLVVSRFNKHYRLRTFAINTKLAKDIIFARLRIEQHGPRFLHFPRGHGYGEEFFQQLTAEVLKTRRRHGFEVQYYEKIRPRNEALDLRVYWVALLDILKPNLQTISTALMNQKTQRQTIAPKPPRAIFNPLKL